MCNIYMLGLFSICLGCFILFMLLWVVEGVRYAYYWVNDQPTSVPLWFNAPTYTYLLNDSFIYLIIGFVGGILWLISIPAIALVCILLIVREIIRGIKRNV